MGLMAADRGHHRGTRRGHVASRDAVDRRAAHQLAAGPPTRRQTPGRRRGVGQVGSGRGQPARYRRSAGTGDPDPAGDPVAVAEPRPKDVAALSTSTTARRAYDLISENFGPGVNGPLIGGLTRLPAQAASGSSSGSSSSSGSDSRATDPRLQRCRKTSRPPRGSRRHTGPDRQGRDHRLLQRDRDRRPGRADHRRPGQHAALRA